MKEIKGEVASRVFSFGARHPVAFSLIATTVVNVVIVGIFYLEYITYIKNLDSSSNIFLFSPSNWLSLPGYMVFFPVALVLAFVGLPLPETCGLTGGWFARACPFVFYIPVSSFIAYAFLIYFNLPISWKRKKA